MKLKAWIDSFPRSERAAARRRIGKRLKLSEVAVRSMANGNRLVQAEYVRDIEEVTGGQVTKHDLRPDLYSKDVAA